MVRWLSAAALFAISLWFAAPRTASAQRPLEMSAFPFGVGRYEPGKWASLGIEATNKSDQDAEGILAVYFGKDPQTQYARKIWVPAKSTRRSWLPIRMPSNIDAATTSIEMTMMTLGSSAQGETLERTTQTTDLFRSSLLIIDRESIKTAAIYRKPLANERGMIPDLDSDAYEMLTQAKQLNESSRVIMEFTSDFAPSHSVMWDSVDQLILCSDRIINDTSGLAVLRSWLHGGGRLMVFLDRVSPETVAAIIGHDLNFQVVDRVELDEFTIETRQSPDMAPVSDRRRFEVPVELVRVLTDSQDVPFRINSWPAAFAIPTGAGELICVALGPRGWTPPPVRVGSETNEENVKTEFRTSQGLRHLSDRFFQARAADRETRSIVEPILQEQVGYRIPSRMMAASLLGANCLGLIALGYWCTRRERLEYVAWMLPLMALTITLIFVAVGRFNNRSVPSTVAFTQVVRAFPATEEAIVSGLAGLYHQENSTLTMNGGTGGIVNTLSEPTGGAIRRFVWGDEDRGDWQNVILPGGSVQFIEFQKTAPFEPKVIARFGPNGVEGRLASGKPLKLEDAVISYPPAPSLLVRVDDQGRFVSGPKDVLAANQFISDQVLSDESRRRQTVYRHLLNVGDYQNFINTPSLLGWSEPVDAGIDWPEDLQRTGTAMLAIPLQFERTPPATQFVLPATFFRPETAATDIGRSTAYNPRTGEWVKEVTRATQTRLRFQLPLHVLPCQITSAKLSIKLNAPSRKLRVLSVIDGQEKLLQEIANPNGVYEIEATQPDQLPGPSADALFFTFVITESAEELASREEQDKRTADLVKQSPPTPESIKEESLKLATSFTTWQIDYVRLDARGVTAE